MICMRLCNRAIIRISRTFHPQRGSKCPTVDPLLLNYNHSHCQHCQHCQLGDIGSSKMIGRPLRSCYYRLISVMSLPCFFCVFFVSLSCLCHVFVNFGKTNFFFVQPPLRCKLHIHPKSGKIGGDYFSAQKNWRKKCVFKDNKILRKKVL